MASGVPRPRRRQPRSGQLLAWLLAALLVVAFVPDAALAL
jgi:hypothetical protein